MKYVDNILYIEFAEMVRCGVSDKYLKKARSAGTKCWAFLDDPADRRKVLIAYEKLKDIYQKKVRDCFGNPYEYMAKMPIRNLVKWDDAAEAFYLAYRYDVDRPLPVVHVKKYTWAASWLNMFNRVTLNKRNLKKQLNLTIEQFYVHALEVIKADGIDLPTSYRRLLATRRGYQATGYESLVDWRFGNKLAAKIKDELSESTLLEMISHPNQFDDVFIAQQYNAWAVENNYKVIDASTVGVHRRKNEHLIIMQREGNAALHGKYLRQVKGFRPTAPLYMVESDDNHIDLLFIDPDDTTSSRYFHKYKAIVVIDSFNDYVLGYAYAETLSVALVQAAYLNAMYHIRSLTGAWHLPHETKTDRWAIASLEPFYKSLGNYFKTPVGSKHRGYIEQFFGDAHWKRCLKIGANNYTGNNITATARGVNTEYLERNKKDYPLIGDEAMVQLENFFHRLRHMPQRNGVSKQAEWLKAFQALGAENKRAINDEQFLLKFGVTHKNTVRITNRGVEPTINRVKYSYDLDSKNLLTHIGKQVHICYDPFDMSRVLITDFEGVRLIGQEARYTSRSLADAQTDSRAYLNAVLTEKRDTVDYIAKRTQRRKAVLREASVDAETLLQAGVMVKEIKQRAEQKVLTDSIDRSAYDVFEQM